MEQSRDIDKCQARVHACLLSVMQVTPLEVDDGLLAICGVVAEVKGWTREQAARKCLSNFKGFYKDQLEAAASEQRQEKQ